VAGGPARRQGGRGGAGRRHPLHGGARLGRRVGPPPGLQARRAGGRPPDAFSATGQDWGPAALPLGRDGGGRPPVARRPRQPDGRPLRLLPGGPRGRAVPDLLLHRHPGRHLHARRGAGPDRHGETVLGILARRARVIAEDLGVVPPFIRASLDRLAIPGYRVQRWERDYHAAGQPFLDPATWPAVSVATTGTHDTDSVADWYESLSDEDRTALLALPGPGAAQGPRLRPLRRGHPRRHAGDALRRRLRPAAAALPGLLRPPRAGSTCPAR